MSAIRLVVNADDLGLTEGVNRGIARAHREGIVTSASLMVLGEAVAGAAAWARQTPTVAVGVHLDMGEWVHTGSEWVERYRIADRDDPDAVDRACRAQVARFVELIGRAPTHLDSHQHVHRRPMLRPVFEALARELGVPLRDALGAPTYVGAFYGQTPEGSPLPDGITVDALLVLLRRLGAGDHELACHPADRPDAPAPYVDERVVELATLCDPTVRDEVEGLGIELAARR